MRIHVRFTLGEIDPAVLSESTAIVVDVVRATTSIVEALANGAGSVYAMESTEDAVRLAQSLGREDTVLCGERKGVKVEGFDLGNSPAEFTSEAVEGKKLVMSTTNGTRALGAVSEAKRVVVAAFTNLGAVARAVAADESVVIVCAGRAGLFAIDDALCAGHLIRRIGEAAESEPELDDASRASAVLADSLQPSRDFFDATAAGQAISAIDLADDLDICGDADRHDIVPFMNDQVITLSGE
jgi:2-phosphosulfolactate phosphatase